MTTHTNKQIAEALRTVAPTYPEYADTHAPRAEFRFGTLTLRCKPTREAVEAVAYKFDKKSNPTTWSGGRVFTTRNAYAKLQTVGPWEWWKV